MAASWTNPAREAPSLDLCLPPLAEVAEEQLATPELLAEVAGGQLATPELQWLLFRRDWLLGRLEECPRVQALEQALEQTSPYSQRLNLAGRTRDQEQVPALLALLAVAELPASRESPKARKQNLWPAGGFRTHHLPSHRRRCSDHFHRHRAPSIDECKHVLRKLHLPIRGCRHRIRSGMCRLGSCTMSRTRLGHHTRRRSSPRHNGIDPRHIGHVLRMMDPSRSAFRPQQ